MKSVFLSKGKMTLVDDGDYEKVIRFSWYAIKNKAGNWYASRNADSASSYKFMHNMLLGTYEEVDHKDGDGLNNTRGNLRVVTRKQNSYNRIGRFGRRWKGVSKIKSTGRWRAYISPDRKQVHLGVYRTAKEAAIAYDKKAVELWGKYAKLNFPQPGYGCILDHISIRK